MARSITFKFGADTSQLTRSLKGMKKSIGGMLGGMGGIGGMLGAGIAGFGIQQLIGAAMNISPKFANSMLELEEKAVRGLAAALYQVEPQLLMLADALPGLIAGVVEGAAALVTFYTEIQKGTTSAAGSYAGAATQLLAGNTQQAGQGFMAGFGALLNAGATAVGMDPIIDPRALAWLDASSQAVPSAASAIGGQARTQANPAQSANPMP